MIKKMDKPAIIGGRKEFEEFLPIVRPSLPTLSQISVQVEEVLASGMVTNFSKYTQQLERECGNYLNVNFSLSQPNATTGLLLLCKVLGLTGEVIVPSFTFSATVHALIWNGLTPVFVDIDPETFNIDPKLVEEKITDKTSAILGVHIFGNPCDVKELEEIARKHDLKLLFDAAHAFGSEYQGKKIGGCGDAEVFSMSGTKLLVTGEGGLITTTDKDLSDKLRLARNYGDPGNYNCVFVGFNGKMSEFSAIIGLQSLKDISGQVRNRNIIRNIFEQELRSVPGISFQKIREGNITSVKDFSIIVDKNEFGISRDQLAKCLAAENIHSKKYFYPPIHFMDAYREFHEQYYGKLPHTEKVSWNILCLPIHSTMSEEQVKKICNAIRRIQHFHQEIVQEAEDISSVLITGGAGYVGVVLARQLLEQGYKVKILDQLIFGKEPLQEIEGHPNFSLEVGVVEDKYVVEKSLEGIDAVIHLSGLSNDPSCELNSDLTKKSNIDATKVLLQFAKAKGVKRFINASSCSVYGFTNGVLVDEQSPPNPLTAYAKSKVKSEELVLAESEEDFVTVCLRKSTIYGPSPRMRFDLVINTMTGMGMSEGKIVINGGEQWRPFLHVEDAASAYLFMLQAPKEQINGQVFNVGSNYQNIKIIDLAHRIAAVLPGVKVEQSHSPDKRSYLVSFDKISALGWKATFDIEDGVHGVKKLFDEGKVKNFRDLNYFNIKRMISYLNV